MLCKTIVFLLIDITFLHAKENKYAPEPYDEKKTAINALEMKRNDIFRQINAAIDESVTYLQKSNDSEADEGMKEMKDLKKQIKLLKVTSDEEESYFLPVEKEKEDYIVKDGVKTRRAIKYPLSIFDPDSVDAKLKPWKRLKKEKDRKQIQTKIEEWLKSREEFMKKKKLEKKKKQEQQLLLMLEKCPNEGIHKQKKRYDQKGKSNRFKYPCCRKCCKRSYMGCL